MSEMSSTGRDSKVDMVVADTEMGDATYHASQFLSSLVPHRDQLSSGSSMSHPFIRFRLLFASSP